MNKFNHKILSFPPYISTLWENINALYMKEVGQAHILVICLNNHSNIEIPNLEHSIVEQIFLAHKKFLERNVLEREGDVKKKIESHHKSSEEENNTPFAIGTSLESGEESGLLDNFQTFLQHNSSQANAPDLSSEVLNKISEISQFLGINLEQINIPQTESYCNCTYCQIVRAIQTGVLKRNANNEDEKVSETDLTFRKWDIKQKSDKLYDVSNPIDHNEHYQVFLGNPIGCTCGEKNCEHIRTVLNS